MKSVLVVDDDPDIRELIVWKLTQAGSTTSTPSDGEEGLAAAMAGDADGRGSDVIVIDWMMPKMPGIDLCRALRENPSTAAIPIIVLTAKAQDAEVQAGFAAGADDYIVKPFSPRDLVSRVQALIERSETPR